MQKHFTDPDSSVFTWFSGEPINGGTVFCNRWWITHPEKGLPVFRGHSPQCNSNEKVTRRLAQMYPWAVVEFRKVAVVRIS